jgi:hypothetical protein
MISKKNLSKSQRFALFMIDLAEKTGENMKWTMFLGASIFGAVFIHQQVNNYIQNNCDRTIYQIVEAPTAFGPAYRCVSRVQKQGPAPTFKD